MCGCLYYTISSMSYIHIYLYHFYIILLLFELLSFTPLATRQVLQFKITIIITIFQTESFHFFHWKVSQLKWFSLIKLTSKHFTSTGKKLFSQRKELNESQRQCTKITQQVIWLYRDLCLWKFCFFVLFLWFLISSWIQGFPNH